ncbi:MAG TPA: zinc-ribbon domain-containing protein [Blastocatellia bacterium]
MQCTNCGANLKAGARFCPHCAFDLSQADQSQPLPETQVLQPRACKNCGATLKEGARFCMNCARPVDAGSNQGPVYGGQAADPAYNMSYMPNAGATAQKNLKPIIIGGAIAALVLIAALVGYLIFSGGSGSPSDVARRYVRALESGNGNELLSLLSKRQLASLGIDRTNEAQMKLFNEGMGRAAAQIKSEGGVAGVETKNENITGETATVDVTVKPGQGQAETQTVRLIREDGQWKIDELPGM